jgi:hypothetical protein
METMLPVSRKDDGNKAHAIVIRGLHCSLESQPVASFSLRVTCSGAFAHPSKSTGEGLTNPDIRLARQNFV